MGIWQTVWLEPVPDVALARPRITPDVANGQVHLVQRLHTAPWSGRRDGLVVRATLQDAHGSVAAAECDMSSDLAAHLSLAISCQRLRLWSPADPHLTNWTSHSCRTTASSIEPPAAPGS